MQFFFIKKKKKKKKKKRSIFEKLPHKLQIENKLFAWFKFQKHNFLKIA